MKRILMILALASIAPRAAADCFTTPEQCGLGTRTTREPAGQTKRTVIYDSNGMRVESWTGVRPPQPSAGPGEIGRKADAKLQISFSL